LLAERLAVMDDACRRFDYEQALALLVSLVKEYSPARHGDGELLWHAMARPVRGEVVVH